MAGTAYAKIDRELSPFAPYNDFRQGDMSITAYQNWIEGQGSEIVKSLNQDQINLSARFPREKHEFVRQAISHCRAVDLLDHDSYEAEAAEEILSNLDAHYAHGDHMTYIFPEEAALLFAIVRNARPRCAAFMGSYYGYWAAAAKAAHPSLDITLLDINKEVMDLAQKNFENLGLANGVTFTVGDAETRATSLANIDLLVLDAEGPKSDDTPADYRDKAIYYPHLKAALKSIVPGGLVIAHNVILSNFTQSCYFKEKQDYYRKQYVKFLALLRQSFSYTIIDSSEGVLVARKA